MARKKIDITVAVEDKVYEAFEEASADFGSAAEVARQAITEFLTENDYLYESWDE